MVIFRPLVWLAVLSTTAILACKDDPLSLDGTGRLTITVVPYEGAQAEASAASNKVGPEKEEAKAARQTAAAPPLRDLIRVNVNGPEVRTLEFIPNADGSVDVTVNSLQLGPVASAVMMTLVPVVESVVGAEKLGSVSSSKK